jgi:hypothetical protein
MQVIIEAAAVAAYYAVNNNNCSLPSKEGIWLRNNSGHVFGMRDHV